MYSSFKHLGGKMIAPNLAFAPYETQHGIKQFLLTAEEVYQSLVKGVTIQAWGFNGSTPGPVIVVNEGDRVQIALRNRLKEATAIHWHGLVVPNDVDGVPGIGAGPVVGPGETYTYDFVVQQSGTYMYHAHAMDAEQEMMGLSGMFISLPRYQKVADREYIILLQEWHVKKDDMKSDDMMMNDTMTRPEGTTNPSVYEIDPMSMDFNYFTMNGKSFPDTAPLRVRYGEHIRIRLGNLSMNSHPMHVHGHFFQVIASDGAPLPAPMFKNTMNVAPGETWDIEFQANNPGVWAFHCHKPHHMTNAHQTKMGGMFTTIQYV